MPPPDRRTPYQKPSHWRGGGPGGGGGGKQSIEVGTAGLLFTVDGPESPAVREARRLIEQYLPIVMGEAQQQDSGNAEAAAPEADSEDVADALKKACQEAGSSRGPRRQIARQLQTGVKNCLFFTVEGIKDDNREKLYELVDTMVAECQKQQRCRFLGRVLPAEETCSADVNEISDKLTHLVGRHLKAAAEEGLKNPTFAIEFKARNYDKLSRAVVIEIVGDLMKTIAPESKVNLSSPDLTIVVSVVWKTVLLSCVRRFKERRQLALRVESETTKPQEEKKAVDVDSSSEKAEASVAKEDEEHE